MPKISLNPLSLSSIENVIAELERYERWIKEKTDKLRSRISGELWEDIEVGFNGAYYDYVLNEGARVPDVRVSVKRDGNIDVVVAYGREAIFAEFGAGVYYNGPVGSYPHPNPPQGIVAIGTYGKGYGARKVWGYYDEAGNLKLTHGTPASMPMYHAVQDIIPRIVKIAKEVFKE